MPTERPAGDETLAQLIEAMYEFIRKHPKYVMPIHDIYALYDIATVEFSRTMGFMAKTLKKLDKSEN